MPIYSTLIHLQTLLIIIVWLIMQTQSQPPSVSWQLLLKIVSKVVVTATKWVMYFRQISKYQQLPNQSMRVTIPLAILLIVAVIVEVISYRKVNQGQIYNRPLTLLYHILTVLGVLPIVLVFKSIDNVTNCLVQIVLNDFYFTEQLMLLFSCFSAIACLLLLISRPIIVDKLDFFQNYEPIDETIVYFFIALYLGIVLDIFVFERTMCAIFISLNLLIILAGVVWICRTKRMATFKQEFKRS